MANDQSGEKGQVGARHFILASLVDEDRVVPLLSDFTGNAPAVNDYVLLGISTSISTFISVIVYAHLGKPNVPFNFAHWSWAWRWRGRQLRRDDIVVGVQLGTDSTRRSMGAVSYWYSYGY